MSDMVKNPLCPICGNEVKLNKVEMNGGMDGRYYNWEITCDGCHLLRASYPADCFYGREYYETPESVFKAFIETIKQHLIL